MTARHCAFLVPGDLNTRTGGYTYDRLIIDGLRALGWQVDLHDLGTGYPAPENAARVQAQRVVDTLPDGTLTIVDGLAFGVMPQLAHANTRRMRWIALVHHPLSQESGLNAEQRQALFESERSALAAAHGVIVTSPFTARSLAEFDVAPARIRVVEPGTTQAPLASGSGDDGLSLLCVATITVRKGHAVLVEALAGLKDRRWTLHCAGSLSMDVECAHALTEAIERHGLQDRVVLHGERDAQSLNSLYSAADAFVLPSFHEGYGMALAEALARGLPVISTRAGAIVDTVPPDAGELVPQDDVPALRAALKRLMDDEAWRAGLASGARAARSRLPTWQQSSANFAAALADLGDLAHVDEKAGSS